MSDAKHIVCPSCSATNRLPAEKLGRGPKCGKCGEPLFSGTPAVLTDANFEQHVSKSDVPVIVDFWAPWCGPCKMMAPQFEQAAKELEPGVRFAKLNTDEAQGTAARFNIRSIPTIALFRNGREVARQPGAMSAADIVRWVKASIANPG
jgi:thioredoxin 2